MIVVLLARHGTTLWKEGHLRQAGQAFDREDESELEECGERRYLVVVVDEHLLLVGGEFGPDGEDEEGQQEDESDERERQDDLRSQLLLRVGELETALFVAG